MKFFQLNFLIYFLKDYEYREVRKFVNIFHLAAEESWLHHISLDVILG